MTAMTARITSTPLVSTDDSDVASAPSLGGVTHGSALRFETVAAAEGDTAPVRLRPREDVLLRVVAGFLRLSVRGEERVLGPGAEAIVPAAAPYRLGGVDRPARVVMGFSSPR